MFEDRVFDEDSFLSDFDEEETYTEIEESAAIPCDYYGNFAADVQNLAVQEIDRFFAQQKMYCGGSISPQILHSPVYLTQVLNTDISHGVDLAYEAIKRGAPVTDEEIAVVLKTLDKLAQTGVPKEFAGGILLMYLELCEGVEFDSP